jgi:hypothetical protein
MNSSPPPPPAPEYGIPLGPFRIFSNIREDTVFASQGAPLVSTTPVANFATSFASVVDTGVKFSTGINDTGGKFELSTLKYEMQNLHRILLQTDRIRFLIQIRVGRLRKRIRQDDVDPTS